jgi:hypothetical protein
MSHKDDEQKLRVVHILNECRKIEKIEHLRMLSGCIDELFQNAVNNAVEKMKQRNRKRVKHVVK